MMCGITGTPGTGKSTVADELARRGTGWSISRISCSPTFREKTLIGTHRSSIPTGWETSSCTLTVLSRGTLPTCCLVIRSWCCVCGPTHLPPGSSARGYSKEKIRENRDAEALDVCLIETVEEYEPDEIFELDTTGKTPAACADAIEQFYRGEIPASFGTLDWSAFAGVSS